MALRQLYNLVIKPTPPTGIHCVLCILLPHHPQACTVHFVYFPTQTGIYILCFLYLAPLHTHARIYCVFCIYFSYTNHMQGLPRHSLYILFPHHPQGFAMYLYISPTPPTGTLHAFCKLPRHHPQGFTVHFVYLILLHHAPTGIYRVCTYMNKAHMQCINPCGWCGRHAQNTE